MDPIAKEIFWKKDSLRRDLKISKNVGNPYFCNWTKNNETLRLLVLIGFYRMSSDLKLTIKKNFGNMNVEDEIEN